MRSGYFAEMPDFSRLAALLAPPKLDSSGAQVDTGAEAATLGHSVVHMRAAATSANRHPFGG
jgi:hypothetical protein